MTVNKNNNIEKVDKSNYDKIIVLDKAKIVNNTNKIIKINNKFFE